MKIEKIFIQPLKREFVYYIGKSKEDNFAVIDAGSNDDLWFHAANESSCHIVCIVPQDIDKNETKYINKVGAILCKNNTNKLKSKQNVEFIYTQIKNITKTNIQGCVQTKHTKSITV